VVTGDVPLAGIVIGFGDSGRVTPWPSISRVRRRGRLLDLHGRSAVARNLPLAGISHLPVRI
jgi:hypothetical protein